MLTTVVNPRRRRPAARRRTRRYRRNDENPRFRRRRRNDENPRRRYRRRNDDNPWVRGYYRRRRRRNEENPSNPEFAIDRILAATAGGATLRLLLKQIAGDRGADGKLTAMHYLTAAGAIYFAPDLAGIVTADPVLQRAAADGAAGVAGQFLIDEHLDDFSAKYLFQAKPATGGLAPLRGLAAREDYERLMGVSLGQAGGQFVVMPDGSVVWQPGGAQPTAGVSGLGAEETLEVPAHAKPGSILRDPRTGKRYRLRVDAAGEPLLMPLSGMGEEETYKRLAGA